MTGTGPALILAGVDRAAFVAAFVARLRDAGVAVAPASAAAFGQALELTARRRPSDISRRDRLYWLARLTLVRTHVSLATFDEVFRVVFDDAVFSLDPVAMRNGAPTPPDTVNAPTSAAHAPDDEEDSGLPWATLPRYEEDDSSGDDDDAAPLWLPRPGSRKPLVPVPFEALDERTLDQLERWLVAAGPGWPARRSRRTRASTSRGAVDLRRTIAVSRRTGGEPVTISRRAPIDRPRNVVMICDVSQSMQSFTSAYLHVMRALHETRAVLAAQTETFAFATALTRMTPLLRHHSISEAIDQASAAVVDRFGGTRIASSIATVLRSHHAQQLRGSICLIASDGWDADPPDELRRQMARLSRRAHQVIWLNPRAGAPDYRPLTGGMAAALPFCDVMLPAATVADVPALLEVITAGRARVSSTA